MSSSSSSSSNDDDDERHSKKRRHEHATHRHKESKKEKKRHSREHKKRKEHKHRKEHHKHKKEKKAPVQRSIITGKKIKREKDDDAEGEARRQALLAHFNEGEDEDVAAAFAAQQRAPQGACADARARAQQALADPVLMRQLMEASAEAQAAKRQRLSSLQRSANGGSGLASLGDSEYASSRPHDYKRERAAAERNATQGGW